MQRVFVLNSNKEPLMPCQPARARMLLRDRRAKVFRRYPFVIILTKKISATVQPIEIKFDPGSRTTGIALVGEFPRGRVALFVANLEHRGLRIKKLLDSRRTVRRGRRHRNCRYRPARFDNRCRPKGWLPPSLMSRVDNVATWMRRLKSYCPITSVRVETVRFDTQLMERPEISGVEYQQGTLAGYELREYLLEKWGRKCAYCGAVNIPLQVEHIRPSSKGGSNRVSNLTLSCNDCNQTKDNMPIEVFLKNKPTVLKKILAQAKTSLRDAAAMNATRYAIGRMLKSFKLPVSFWSGGRTKFNRISQGYEKDHWIDAVCVGETGSNVLIPKTTVPLLIKAMGRGSRQMCRVDKFGFPRTSAKSAKIVKGFQTGDLVKAIVTKGKKIGKYIGRVAVRKSGSFNIKTATKTVQGVSWKNCQLIQRVDGYLYF
jgi:5-methylcytosine-specific restriction endonuclease McrA